MGDLSKARQALKDLKLLKAGGYAVKDGAIQLLQGKVWEAEGLKQIWWCVQCPGWTQKMFVSASAIGCEQGHVAVLLWEIPKEPLSFLFDSAQDQQQSRPSRPFRENTQPLLGSLDKLPLQPLPELFSQKKTED